MLMCLFLLDVVFNHRASGSEGISCIENLDDDVRAVDDLVQLVPDALALSGAENVFPGQLLLLGDVAPQVLVLLLAVARFGVLDGLWEENLF